MASATEAKMGTGYKSSRQVITRIGTYTIDKPRGERAKVYRPSGMFVGFANTIPEARNLAWRDAAALCCGL